MSRPAAGAGADPAPKDRRGDFDAIGPGVIYVDGNVGSGEYIDDLRKHAVKATIGRLHSADFAFRCGHTRPSPFCAGDNGCTIGIERKTLSDCCGSLLKNRMGKQIPDLLTDYTLSWIVVEGVFRPGNDDAIEIPMGGKWTASRVGLTYSQLSSWLVRYDVMGAGRLKRWRTSSPRETMAFIASLYRWWQKEWDKHSAEAVAKMPQPMKALLFKPNQMERIAVGFDTIGFKHMRKVCNHFRSIQEFINASEAELRKAGLRKADAAYVYVAIRRLYR